MEQNPTDPVAYWHLGLAHFRQGQVEEAEAAWMAGLLTLPPEQSEAGLADLIALLYQEAERHQGMAPEQAEPLYHQVLTLQADHAPALYGLGLLLYQRGEAFAAATCCLQALQREPDQSSYRQLLARCLTSVAFTAITPPWRQAIVTCLADPTIPPQSLAVAAASVVKLELGLTEQLPHWRQEPELLTTAYQQQQLGDLLTHDLLRSLLLQTLIVDPDLEWLLTQLRQVLFLTHLETPMAEATYDFLVALALQCFYNDYSFAVNPIEAAALGLLTLRLETALAEELAVSESLPQELLLYSLYASLTQLKGCDRLPLEASPWRSSLGSLVQVTLGHDRVEQALKAQVPCLTPIEDATSQAVRAQYETHPYPRWRQLPPVVPTTIKAVVQAYCPHWEAPDFLDQPLPLLIAGCGTGQQAILAALSYPQAQVLAVDLSYSSLAYAARMTQELGVRNLTFYQGDILNLGRLDRPFPVIECTGVLHHLKDPLAGWRVLVNLLEPGGLMRIGLYSTQARSAVRAAQQLIQEQGFPPTDAGIRQARQKFLQLDPNHPAAGVTRIGDFYSLSECRDLLFHVQENTFTLPQIGDCLKQLGLKFLGFELPASVRAAYQRLFPQDGTATNLALWDQFEAQHPNTFIGMYLFWCQLA